MRIAFLGLGAIGRPMAARLAGQHQLTVWNRTAERAREFAAAHGARAAATPREAVTDAAVVITCLPTSADVEGLLGGPQGIEAGLARGALFLDCTSGDAAATRRIAARLAGREVSFADAPVSGGTNGAESGTLTVMVGGEHAVFERALPVLQAFGKRIVHMGPLGSGDAMKAVNNALLAVNILALAEGLTALAKAGVNPRVAVETLNTSSGRSFVSESLIPERVLTGTWPRTFRLALLDKDVGICIGLLEELGLPAPLLERAALLLHEARVALGEQADYLEPIRLQEQRAGVEIRGVTAPPILVLVGTQDIVNIAGAVRLARNFGLTGMRLVQPAVFDPWRIEGIAHNTADFVSRITLHDSLADATRDCVYLTALTARERTAKRSVLRPRPAAALLAERSVEGPVALVAGREDRGLTNEELDHCHALVTIETMPDHRSLNLAHAVGILCYETWLAQRGGERPVKPPRREAPAAPSERLELLFRDWERALWAIEFFKTRRAEIVMRSVREALFRADLDWREAALLRAMALETVRFLERTGTPFEVPEELRDVGRGGE